MLTFDLTKGVVNQLAKVILDIHKKVVAINDDPVEMRQGTSLEFLIFDAARKAKKDEIDFAIHLMKGIAENHPFIEGNKRTAYVVGKMLLVTNGVLVCLKEDIAVQYMRHIAQRKEKEDPKTFSEVKTWLLINCEEIPFDALNNDLKLYDYLTGHPVTEQEKIKKYIKLHKGVDTNGKKARR